MRRIGAAVVVAAGLLACHSPGPYGYSKVYSPLDEEAQAAANAKPYDPVMAERFPEDWKGKPVSVFGVVTNRHKGEGGATRVTLSVRVLAQRNACDEGGEETCRVTVSEREHGVVDVVVKLRPGDLAGSLQVDTGSLLRVIGAPTENLGPGDASPTIEATYYRHWPRNYYITTAAQSIMRR